MHMVIFLRAVILYILVVVVIRFTGKRQIGELEPTELVLALLIADLAAVPIQDLALPLIHGIIPILTLLALSILSSFLSMKSVTFRTLLCGRPSVLIRNGIIDQMALKKNRFTLDELSEELRAQGYTDIATLKYVVLETDGKLSILPFANQKPVTAEQMNLTPEDRGLPMVLISDGRLNKRNLSACGYDRQWLEDCLALHGAATFSDVFLLTVDEIGGVYFAAKKTD